MKANLLYSLKSNACAGEKCNERKVELTILLSIFITLALASCETMESGSSGGAVVSSWPAATGHSASPANQTGFASGLGGQWYHDGKPTSIRVDPGGRNLTIIDESGRRTQRCRNFALRIRISKGETQSLWGPWRTAHFLEQWHNVDSGTTQRRI